MNNWSRRAVMKHYNDNDNYGTENAQIKSIYSINVNNFHEDQSYLFSKR